MVNARVPVQLPEGLDLRSYLQSVSVEEGLLAEFQIRAPHYENMAERPADDRGGKIGVYVDKYQDLRTSGETVIIDGLCASACTIVLGKVPHDRICVTSHASLGFHAAWDYGDNGRPVPNPEATHMLYLMYPPAVRKWINDRGGLTRNMIFLRGKQLQALYKPCYLNAQASAPKPAR